jgi:hypothetical protein
LCFEALAPLEVQRYLWREGIGAIAEIKTMVGRIKAEAREELSWGHLR